MTGALALLAAAAALWPEPRRLVSARLDRLGWGQRGPARRGLPRLPSEGPLRRWVFAAGAALAAGLLVGGAAGAGAAGLVLLVAERGLRRLEATDHLAAEELRRELPVACDLLAVCVSAGLPLPAALAAVGGEMTGALGTELRRVAALCRLGADAGTAWEAAPAVLEPLARILRRSEASGARAAPALHALAAEARAAERAAIDVAVRRAGVRILAPLGLCFLPAFVCLGIVPLVIGIAGDVLG